VIFAKLDVCFWRHKKFMRAGAAACGYYAAALTYLREDETTDGVLEDDVLGQVLGVGTRTARKHCERLEAVGLFTRVARGYALNGYADKNETKEQIDSRREATRAKLATWRKRNQVTNRNVTGVEAAPVTVPVTSSESESESESDQNKQTPNLRLVPTGGTADSGESASVGVTRVFQHWAKARAQVTGCTVASLKLTAERRRKVQARLRDGYTADQLCQAIDGMMATPFNVEKGFNDLELACRDASHVDRYLQGGGGGHVPRSHRPAKPVEAPPDAVTGPEADANIERLKQLLSGAGVPPWERAGE